ncbi:hypothetical protein GGR54DRAFT_609438, partial [Hypoxylon sp. NC1633]
MADTTPSPETSGRKSRGRPKRTKERNAPYTSTRPRHSNNKKKEVLVWLACTKIPLQQSIAIANTLVQHNSRHLPTDGLDPLEPGYRRPTLPEASAFFRIPRSTIRGWWSRRDDILAGDYGKKKG